MREGEPAAAGKLVPPVGRPHRDESGSSADLAE
jgi:hypothetical protein